jgi:hypothetical protein
LSCAPKEPLFSLGEAHYNAGKQNCKEFHDFLMFAPWGKGENSAEKTKETLTERDENDIIPTI